MQKIIVTGRLGRDASVNESTKGGNFLSFRIASNHRRNGIEKTTWYDVLAFNYESRFKNMAKYLTKGSSVIVTGDYDDELEEYNGERRIRRTILVDSIEFNSDGSGKKEGDNSVDNAPNTATSASASDEKEIVVTATKRSPKKAVAVQKEVEEEVPAPVVEDGGEEDLPF